MRMVKEKAYFPCLDAIRTFACFFPISTHLFWETFSSRFEQLQLPLAVMDILAFLFGNGSFGVRLFMVMSGFLITYLMFQEYDATGGFSVPRFYMRRVLRIWPVYFLVIGYVYLIYPWVKWALNVDFPLFENPWRYIFFLGNFEFIRTLTTPGIYPNSQISLTWSVGIEEQFYLIWPLLFAWSRTAGICWGAVACWLLSLASHFYFYSQPLYWNHHTAPCFLYIASGALMAVVFYYRSTSVRDTLGRLSYPVTVLLTVVFFFLLFRIGIQAGQNLAWLPFYGVATATFCCWLMASQIVHQEHPWNLCKMRPMVNFSKYTYGLYMYHRIVQWIVYRVFFAGLALEASGKWLGLANCLTLLGGGLAAWASYHTIEAYFYRQKHL